MKETAEKLTGNGSYGKYGSYGKKTAPHRDYTRCPTRRIQRRMHPLPPITPIIPITPIPRAAEGRACGT